MLSTSEMLAATPFDSAQRAIAELILTEFSKAGLPAGIGWAAVVNAWGESMLDPLVCYGRTPWGADRGFGPVPGSEDSCGLFQLNAATGAAGEGLSSDQRMDPHTNTRRIISIVQGPSGDAIRAQADSGESLATLTATFTADIERPANRFVVGEERAELAEQWWGEAALASASTLPLMAVGAALLPLLAILLGAGALAFLFIIKK